MRRSLRVGSPLCGIFRGSRFELDGIFLKILKYLHSYPNYYSLSRRNRCRLLVRELQEDLRYRPGQPPAQPSPPRTVMSQKQGVCSAANLEQFLCINQKLLNLHKPICIHPYTHKGSPVLQATYMEVMD